MHDKKNKMNILVGYNSIISSRKMILNHSLTPTKSQLNSTKYNK